MLKHAFIINVHKDFEQIKSLLTILDFGDIYIHVDKKSNDLFKTLKKHYRDKKNIYFVEKRINVNWSGFSQVEATLELLKLVKNKNIKYDYIHFISGQDLLLMTQNELDCYLIQNGLDKEYIEVDQIGSYKWRLNQYSLFRESPNNRTLLLRLVDILLRYLQKPFIQRDNLKEYELFKGSSWFSVTHNCMLFILEVVKTSNFIDRFKYTACPDEHFFQILVMNSKFKKNVLKYNGRYVYFEKMNPSPKILSLDDYVEFMNGKYMFARKFDKHIHEDVFYMVLEKHIN